MSKLMACKAVWNRVRSDWSALMRAHHALEKVDPEVAPESLSELLSGSIAARLLPARDHAGLDRDAQS